MLPWQIFDNTDRHVVGIGLWPTLRLTVGIEVAFESQIAMVPVIRILHMCLDTLIN